MDLSRRTLLFTLAVGPLAATLSAIMGQATSAVPPAARLGSTVFHWETLPVKPTATGSRRDVANQPTATLEKLECHFSTLNAGMISHPPHRHPQEEFIIIKAGTLNVLINGKVQRAGPGSLLFFASGDLHNMTNIGDKPATYLVFQVTTAATHLVPDGAEVGPAGPGRLASGVFEWDTLAVKNTRTGKRRDIVDSPTATLARFECHVTTLNPGEIPHAAHHHPDEELVIVKSGELEVTINGAVRRADPGSIVFFGSNDEHGLKNDGASPATYYVIRLGTTATPGGSTP